MIRKVSEQKAIDNSIKICLAYYLKSMHSTEIIALINFDSDEYVETTLTENDLLKLVRITRESSARGGKLKIALNGFGKKSYNEISAKTKFFCKQAEIDNLKADFKQNEGYLIEFLYRIKQGEKIEDIKKANNSVSYSTGSDTKDGKQVKMFKTNTAEKKITGCSLVTLEYLLKSCKEQGIITEELIEAVETLRTIYGRQ
jgi:hypothetical protein